MSSAIDPLLAWLPALESKIEVLLAKKETKRKGSQLQAELTKQKPRLEKLSGNENWKGNYNLLTQYANAYGVQRHASLWSSFGCDVPIAADKEAEFPVSDEHRKPDCIIASKCEVWEFKADSAGGRADGARQRDSYQKIVPTYYTERHRKGEPAASALGGSAIKQKCLRGDEIAIVSRLHLYDMCKVQYECISGE